MAHKAKTTWFGGVKPCIGDSVSGVALGKNDRGTFIWTALETDNARLESLLSGGRDSVPNNLESEAL